jgi:hypothetical protein
MKLFRQFLGLEAVFGNILKTGEIFFEKSGHPALKCTEDVPQIKLTVLLNIHYYITSSS